MLIDVNYRAAPNIDPLVCYSSFGKKINLFNESMHIVFSTLKEHGDSLPISRPPVQFRKVHLFYRLIKAFLEAV